MRFNLLPLVALALAVSASPTPAPDLLAFGPPTTKHAWAVAPENWQLMGSPPDSHSIRLHIGLKQSNIDNLIEDLVDISTPREDNPRFQQWMSQEEVNEYVQPHPQSVDMVHSWLAAHGVDINSPGCAMHRSQSGDTISINVPIRLAEQMLDTQYGVYVHKNDPDYRVVRSLSYSLPQSLHDHVDLVSPTTMFGTMRAMRSTAFLQPAIPIPSTELHANVRGPSGFAVPTSCNSQITPACLMALYGTQGYVPKATGENSIGIAGYLDEFANFADLKTFAQRFRTDAVNATFQVVQFNGGGNNQSDPGVEANLDIQTTTGLTFPTPNIYYSTGGSPPFIPDDFTPTDTNEPYDQWVTGLLAQTSIPNVISTSYGDDEQTVPPDFATRVCNSFAQIGARGVSLLFSSGDEGVGGGDCKTNDGTNRVLFQPAFPASCPFVTTVGGTQRVNPEVAVGFSGGGFSNLFAQPSYQTAAVNTFLTGLGTKFNGLFNKTGRAYPDVAAQGVNFQIIIGGTVNNVGGTSASCPTVSSVITLLNDFRISQGKTSLGFLNPLLYANPSALNDITSGTNPGCNTTGFTAGKGWDPVTGLGTPNFPKLQTIV